MGVGVSRPQGNRIAGIFRIGRWCEGSGPGDVVAAEEDLKVKHLLQIN